MKTQIQIFNEYFDVSCDLTGLRDIVNFRAENSPPSSESIEEWEKKAQVTLDRLTVLLSDTAQFLKNSERRLVYIPAYLGYADGGGREWVEDDVFFTYEEAQAKVDRWKKNDQFFLSPSSVKTYRIIVEEKCN